MTRVDNESRKWLPSRMKRVRMKEALCKQVRRITQQLQKSPPAHTEIGENIFRYFKKKLKILRKCIKQNLKNKENTMKRHFTEEDIGMANKHMKGIQHH